MSRAQWASGAQRAGDLGRQQHTLQSFPPGGASWSTIPAPRRLRAARRGLEPMAHLSSRGQRKPSGRMSRVPGHVQDGVDSPEGALVKLLPTPPPAGRPAFLNPGTHISECSTPHRSKTLFCALRGARSSLPGSTLDVQVTRPATPPPATALVSLPRF